MCKLGNLLKAYYQLLHMKWVEKFAITFPFMYDSLFEINNWNKQIFLTQMHKKSNNQSCV